jgi:hypothetical protein
MNSSLKHLLPWGFALAASLFAVSADARVKKEGAWPTEEKPVSVKIDGTRPEALRKLADAAGWSLVLPADVKDDSEKIEVVVRDESPQVVLEAILEHGDFVAKRTGKLVTVRHDDGKADATDAATDATAAPATASSTATSDAPDAASERPRRARDKRGDDRTVMGGNLRIEKDEVVDDVAVLGGAIDVYGTVTGNLAVTGGTARVHEGAVIEGDATAIGGLLVIEKGAEVQGDVGVVGGKLERQPGAIVGGKIVDGAGSGDVSVKVDKGQVKTEVTPAPAKPRGRERLSSSVDRAGASLRNTALLFVFGVIVLALGGSRVESLRVEVARAPMRSLALGILGSIGAAVALALLCITVIGIPLAAIALVIGVVATYASVVCVLTTAGGAVLRHKTDNPYVHLAAGCVAFFLLGLLPYVGNIVTAIVVLIGIGTLVSTRMGGLVRKRA